MDTPPPPPAKRKTDKIRQLLSPEYLKSQLNKAWQRFPVTLVYIVLCTLYSIVLIWDIIRPDTVVGEASIISLALGTLLSLTSYQWTRYINPASNCRLAQSGCVIFTIANFLILVAIDKQLTYVEHIGYTSAVTALCVAILFIPAVSHTSLRHQWRYSLATLEAVAVAYLISIIMGITMTVIYFTLSTLFGLNEDKVLLTGIALTSGCIPALVFLCRLPDPALDNDQPYSFGLSIAALCKNVLLPLALVYTAILYIYGLKIVFQWELPKGTVSMMVTGLLSAVLVIMYGLQGYLCNTTAKPSAQRISALFMRLIPFIMLPLLILMSVAVFYRINQYGITPSRLYVATFNIWGYMVMAYIFFAKSPRLNIVATSFAVIFLLTSALPGFNYCTLGMYMVQHKVRNALISYGVTDFPIGYDRLINVINSLPEDEARSIASDLGYLDDYNNHRYAAPLVSSEKTLYRWDIMDKYYHSNNNDIDIIIDPVPLSPIPQGYSSIEYFSKYCNYKSDIPDTVTLSSDITINIPVDSLISIDSSQPFIPAKLSIENHPDDLFMLTGFSIKSYSVNSIDEEVEDDDNEPHVIVAADFNSELTIKGYYLKKNL